MNNSKNNIVGLLAVFSGNVIFGFSFLFSKIALDIVEPIVLIAVRFLTAFIVLNLLVLVGKVFKIDALSFSIKGKPKKNILLLALCQPVIYFIAESYGIKLTSSSFSGTIIAMIPIVGIVVDCIIMRSKINIHQILCAILSVVGVGLTMVGAKDLSSSAIGLILLLIAVMASSLFFVFSKNAATDYNPLERTYIMFGSGCAVYIPLAILHSANDFGYVLGAFKESVFIISIFYLAVASSVVAFLLLNFGSNHVSVSNATLMANITTVISIFAGVVFLHESFSFMQLIGALIIIVSVTIGELAVKKK